MKCDKRSDRGPTEENTAMTVEELILNIACVINCTDHAKHKTERGAGRFLGLKDVSCINKRLEADGKQEAQVTGQSDYFTVECQKPSSKWPKCLRLYQKP